MHIYMSRSLRIPYEHASTCIAHPFMHAHDVRVCNFLIWKLFNEDLVFKVLLFEFHFVPLYVKSKVRLGFQI